MTFTKEQLLTLSRWEYNFHCAVFADWSPNPGEANARLIHQIYKSATGDNRRVCYNCQHSLLSLIRDCGTLYIKDIEESGLKKTSVTTNTRIKGDKVVSKEKIVENGLQRVSVKTETKGKTTKTTKTVTKK